MEGVSSQSGKNICMCVCDQAHAVDVEACQCVRGEIQTLTHNAE